MAILQAIQSAQSALHDDLNTPQALTIIEEVLSKLETNVIHTEQLASFVGLLEFIDQTLGLKLVADTHDITDEQKNIIRSRQNARDSKEWSRSDELRDTLQQEGLTILDTPHGPIWQRI